MKIAKEGYWFILPLGAAAGFALAMDWQWIALGFGLLALLLAGFFRDPERVAPQGEGIVLSPADGKIVGISPARGSGDSELAETRISIFLSPLDVHINRAPIPGTVEEVKYAAGRFQAAFKEEASLTNERNALRIADPQGRRVGVVQIAGWVARRIVCYVKPGDSVALGQRFGLIMFGSRVDLFLPAGCRVEVTEGHRVRGGESVIGRFL
jgi:phosphatidylserine decarboxylase